MPSGVTELGEVSHGVARSPSLRVIVVPLGPAPPPPGGAKRSSPSTGTSPQPWTAPRAPAPAGPPWHIACSDRGGSGPRAGACQLVGEGYGRQRCVIWPSG